MAEAYDAPLPWTGEIAAPLTLFRTSVRPEWIDDFDHVNIAHYLTICDHANWAFWNWINAPHASEGARGGHEYVIVENHVHYLDELTRGMPIHVTTQLLAHDAKRFILFHRVWISATGTLAATNEAKFLGFDLTARRPEGWQPSPAARLDAVAAAHAALAQPDRAGRGIELRAR